MYRSSTGDLAYHDDPPMRGGSGGGGERWDRDRFERMRGGGGGSISGGSNAGGRRGPPARDTDEHFRFQEHDRFPGGRRDIDIHEDYHRRGPPTRVAERERFHNEEFLDRPSRRRPELFDDYTPSEIANRALAPYRRKSVVAENLDIAPVRRPARPGYIRRQSSLDTFDRRPLPRYGEVERIDRIERDEWRPPTNVAIPLPIRERHRSPPRRHRDEEFDEFRYRDIEREREPGRGRQEVEEFREVEVERKKSKVRRSRSQATRSVAQSVRSSSSSSFEEVEVPERHTVGKRGKTRMPKRLVKKQAVIELGYPFEEEDDFIIVKRALEKEHIDEIIKISENYKEAKTTYVYEEKQEEEEPEPPPPPPPPPMEFFAPPPPPPPPASVVYSVHPPASVVHSVHPQFAPAPPAPPTVRYAESVRTVSPSRHGHEVYEERIEESNHIGGPLTVLVPEERRMMSRTERDIKEEIRMLESERRMLKYEREGDYEIVERREPKREVVRIDKDRKGRKKPNPKLVAAMMATLS